MTKSSKTGGELLLQCQGMRTEIEHSEVALIKWPILLVVSHHTQAVYRHAVDAYLFGIKAKGCGHVWRARSLRRTGYRFGKAPRPRSPFLRSIGRKLTCPHVNLYERLDQAILSARPSHRTLNKRHDFNASRS